MRHWDWDWGWLSALWKEQGSTGDPALGAAPWASHPWGEPCRSGLPAEPRLPGASRARLITSCPGAAGRCGDSVRAPEARPCPGAAVCRQALLGCTPFRRWLCFGSGRDPFCLASVGICHVWGRVGDALGCKKHFVVFRVIFHLCGKTPCAGRLMEWVITKLPTCAHSCPPVGN